MSIRAEEFLSRAYRIDQQIQSKIAQLDRLRACAGGSGAKFGDVKVQVSCTDSFVEKTVVKILEEEQAIIDEIDRLVETRREIREVISRVDNVTFRLLLEKRDLLFETWMKICTDLNMGLRWAQMLHKEAVKAVQAVLDEMYPEE